MIRQGNYVKEYRPTIHNVKIPLNAMAYTFSRLGRQEDVKQPLVGKNTDNIDNVANNESKEIFPMKTSIRQTMNQH